MFNLTIFQFIGQHYKGLKPALIILYSFTFLPLSYVFTIFLKDYWYYYSFTFLISLLSAWIFSGVILDILKEGQQKTRTVLEYEFICIAVMIIFIIIPLLASDFANYLTSNVLDSMFQESTIAYPGYSGPSIWLSIAIFSLFFNTYLIIFQFTQRF